MTVPHALRWKPNQHRLRHGRDKPLALPLAGSLGHRASPLAVARSRARVTSRLALSTAPQHLGVDSPTIGRGQPHIPSFSQFWTRQTPLAALVFFRTQSFPSQSLSLPSARLRTAQTSEPRLDALFLFAFPVCTCGIWHQFGPKCLLSCRRSPGPTIRPSPPPQQRAPVRADRKSTRLNSSHW